MELREVDRQWGASATKWVWSSRPEFLFDDDGAERSGLEPIEDIEDVDYSDEVGWWTCDRKTRTNDLAIIYRSAGKPAAGASPVTGPKDFCHVVMATSDAFSLHDDPLAGQFSEQHGCRFVVVAQLTPRIKLRDIQKDPAFSAWGARKASFVRSAMPMPDDVWGRFVQLDGADVPPPPRKASVREKSNGLRVDRQGPEKALENWLAAHPESLRALGLDLRLDEQQMLCSPGHDGTIDLLFSQKSNPRRRVVIELKAGPIRRDAIAQALGYVGWLTSRPNVSGATALVIGNGRHSQVDWVMQTLSKGLVRLVDWDELDLPPELSAGLYGGSSAMPTI